MKVETYQRTIRENAEPGTKKAYRKAPGDFHAAASYAVTLAKKLAQEIVVIPGNSYGSALYHLATLDEDIRKYTVCADVVIAATATPEGLVRMAKVVR